MITTQASANSTAVEISDGLYRPCSRCLHVSLYVDLSLLLLVLEHIAELCDCLSLVLRSENGDYWHLKTKAFENALIWMGHK